MSDIYADITKTLGVAVKTGQRDFVRRHWTLISMLDERLHIQELACWLRDLDARIEQVQLRGLVESGELYYYVDWSDCQFYDVYGDEIVLDIDVLRDAAEDAMSPPHWLDFSNYGNIPLSVPFPSRERLLEKLDALRADVVDAPDQAFYQKPGDQ